MNLRRHLAEISIAYANLMQIYLNLDAALMQAQPCIRSASYASHVMREM